MIVPSSFCVFSILNFSFPSLSLIVTVWLFLPSVSKVNSFVMFLSVCVSLSTVLSVNVPSGLSVYVVTDSYLSDSTPRYSILTEDSVLLTKVFSESRPSVSYLYSKSVVDIFPVDESISRSSRDNGLPSLSRVSLSVETLPSLSVVSFTDCFNMPLSYPSTLNFIFVPSS